MSAEGCDRVTRTDRAAGQETPDENCCEDPDTEPGRQLNEVGLFRETAEFQTEPDAEYLVIGKAAENLEDICSPGSFIVQKGRNQDCKRYYEACLGRENQIGKKIMEESGSDRDIVHCF